MWTESKRSRWRFLGLMAIPMIGLAVVPARGDMISASHASPTTIAGAAAPLIEMNTVSLSNDGTNLTLNISFFNPTISGPSGGANDAVYGFVNLDIDKNGATGVTGATLDSGPQGGFGQYTQAGQGIDAYLSLSSEGDFFGHGGPGLVDLVNTSTNLPVGNPLAISYTNAAGAIPSALQVVIPDSYFSVANGFDPSLVSIIGAGGVGTFSAIVGNVNNATDVLFPTAVPEPCSLASLLIGSVVLSRRLMKRRRKAAGSPQIS